MRNRNRLHARMRGQFARWAKALTGREAWALKAEIINPARAAELDVSQGADSESTWRMQCARDWREMFGGAQQPSDFAMAKILDGALVRFPEGVWNWVNTLGAAKQLEVVLRDETDEDRLLLHMVNAGFFIHRSWFDLTLKRLQGAGSEK